MNRLVDQMLETVRLEQIEGEIFNETFDLMDVVQEQLDVYRPLAAGHRLVLELDGARLASLHKQARISVLPRWEAGPGTARASKVRMQAKAGKC